MKYGSLSQHAPKSRARGSNPPSLAPSIADIYPAKAGGLLPGNGVPGLEPGTCNLIALLLCHTELHSKGRLLRLHSRDPSRLISTNEQAGLEPALPAGRPPYRRALPLGHCPPPIFCRIGPAGQPISPIQAPCATTYRVEILAVLTSFP